MLGISGRVYEWFATYLTGRQFKVLIRETYSSAGHMNTGVPQGSILGPLLFLIYTASLQYLLKSLDVRFHFYADDTQIYLTMGDITETQEKVKQVYEAVSLWMNARKLKLNPEKTEFLLVGSSLRRRAYEDLSCITLDNSQILVSDKVRSLGVTIDSSLTLRNQLSALRRKVTGNLINISRISRFIDQRSRLKLIHNLVLSSVDFCNSLYCELPNKDLRPLQVLVNSAARVVKGVSRHT